MITVAEVEARIARTVSSAPQTQAYIDDVSALVRAFVGPKSATWLDDSTTPPAIKAVVAQEVIFHINFEPGIASEKVDVLATSYAYGGAVTALSEGAQEAIDFFLFGGGRRSKLASVSTIRLAIDRTHQLSVSRDDEYDVWTIIAGDTETYSATYTLPDGNAPDLTGYTGTMFFKRGTEVVFQKAAIRVDNVFTLTLTPEETTAFSTSNPDLFIFKISSDDLSDIQTLVIGDLLINDGF